MKIDKEAMVFIIKYYQVQAENLNEIMNKKLDQAKSNKESRRIVVGTFKKQAKLLNRMIDDLEKLEVEDENNQYKH